MIRRKNGRNPTLPAMSAVYQEYFVECYSVGGHHTALAHFKTLIGYHSQCPASCKSLCNHRDRLIRFCQFAMLYGTGTLGVLF